MNLLLLALILLFSACSPDAAYSQSPASPASGKESTAGDESPSLDKFFQHFNAAGREDNFSLDPGFLLNASFSGKRDKKENSGWMQKITRIRLLILDDKKTTAQQEEWKELFASLHEDRFEELITVRKGQDRVQLLSKERKDGEKEIVFLAGGKDGGGIFLHFRGRFTAKDMENIQSGLQSRDSQ